MRIGVITFPGSLDDRDAQRAVRLAGAEPVALWHGSHDLEGVDALILPGGFSYGDYLRAGAIASLSPIMTEVVSAANAGMPVLGCRVGGLLGELDVGLLVVDADDVLDDRVREDLLGDLLDLRLERVVDGTVDGQLEALADAHAGESGSAGAGEGAGKGLPLGIEQLGLGHHVDDDGGHRGSPSGVEGVDASILSGDRGCPSPGVSVARSRAR